ncbi:hypothetical protein [uncultured Rhodoblastus sp.]|nr:hypothetical protein [uncultured Rhodoblastus sp.]
MILSNLFEILVRASAAVGARNANGANLRQANPVRLKQASDAPIT